ncbi:MAG: export transporter permease LptG [Pseudomonadota bacterium]
MDMFGPQTLYQRYVSKELVKSILLVLIAFLALFGFFDLVYELKSVGKGVYSFALAVSYVALGLPGRLYELAPIAALIGALLALSTLARHSEITVLRASGMSTRNLLGLLARLAIILAVITLLIGELVVPFTERIAQQLRTRALSNVVAKEFSSGLWLKDGRTFVNVKSASPDAELQGLRIYEFDDAARLKTVTDAGSATFSPPDAWKLQEVVRTEMDYSKEQPKGKVEKISTEIWQSALNPDILSVLMVAPERMSIFGLATYWQHLHTNNQKTLRYEIALWKKLFYPLSVLVMFALAMPFAYFNSRSGSVSLKLFGGVMLGIFFHMLNGLFSSLGVINAWPPIASAAAPSALFLFIALVLIGWSERR